MPDAFAHCETLVHDADRDRYLATLFAPQTARPALYALYAFDLELRRIGNLVREPMAGEIRLQWWRDVIHGERDGEAAAVPVAAALLGVLRQDRGFAAMLEEIVDARSFDLYEDPMPSLAAFRAYAQKTNGVIIEIAARILGSKADREMAGLAAFAEMVAVTLQHLGTDAARGQIYVPQDVAAARGARVEDMIAGRMTPEWHETLRDLRREAERSLDAAASALQTIPSAALPAFLPIALTRPALRRLARQKDPLAPDVLPQWRKQWLLWRAARDPQRIF